MASQGPLSTATVADDATVGTITWTNPGNATASDNVYATAVCPSGDTTHYLKCTNFGFSIPAGATINGVLLEVEANNSGGAANAGLLGASNKLVKAGTISGTGVGGTGSEFTATDAYYSLGGATNLWGTTLTDTDVNNSGFGAVFGCISQIASSNTISVDHVRMTVYYTPPAVTSDVTSSAAISAVATSDVTSTAALSRTEVTDATSSAAISRTEVGDVTSSASIQAPQVTSDVTTSAALSAPVTSDVTSTAAVSMALASDVTSTAAISLIGNSDILTTASLYVSGYHSHRMVAGTVRAQGRTVGGTVRTIGRAPGGSVRGGG